MKRTIKRLLAFALSIALVFTSMQITGVINRISGLAENEVDIGTDIQTAWTTWVPISIYSDGKMVYPGKWSYHSDGYIVNAENTSNYTGFYNPLTNYSDMDINMKMGSWSSDDDTLGCMIRFTEDVNHNVTGYVFAYDRGGATHGGLYKITDAPFAASSMTNLVSFPSKMWTYQAYDTVRIKIVGATISVWINGTLITTYTDPDPITSGSYGFFSFSQPDARFKDINGTATLASYNITFDAMGGTSSFPSKTVISTKTYGDLPTATKVGYTFTGWYTSATGGTQVTSNSVVTIHEDQTLYAHWDPNPDTLYTVNHWLQNLNGNSAIKDNVNYHLKESEELHGYTDSTVTPAVKTYSGFTSPSEESITILPAGDAILNYWYIRNKYTVTYNYTYNGGISAEKESEQVFFEGAIDLSTKATKVGDTGTYDPIDNPDGWKFVGWNTDPNATEGLTSLTMGTADITLYAIYRKDFTITFMDVNGSNYHVVYDPHTVYNNATSITCTFPSLTECRVSQTYGPWTALGWSTYTDPNVSTDDINVAGSEFTAFENTIFYGVYKRDLRTNFIYYNGETQETKVVTGEQRLNSSNINNLGNPTIETPKITDDMLYTGDPSNGEWYPVGWTLTTSINNLTDDVIIPEETNVTHSTIVTYYAVYGRDLSITYHDMNGNATNVFSQSGDTTEKVISSNIRNIKYPVVKIENLHNFDGWEPVGWSTSPLTASLSVNHKEGADYTLKANYELYGVYSRPLNVSFVMADNVNTQGSSQYANASDVEGTKTSITVLAPYIPPYTDGSTTWSGVTWTKETSNTVLDDVKINTYITTKDDLTYYAVYSSKLTANFISINGTSKNTNAVSANMYANAYDMEDINYPTITAPLLKTSKYNNLTWNSVGWAEGTTPDSPVVIGENQSFELTGNRTYYGIYKTGVEVTFIDYKGSTKQTKKVSVDNTLTSYDFSQVKKDAISPKIDIYNDGVSDWIIRGWTKSTAANTDVVLLPEASFTATAKETYYAVYEKDVTLTLIDYDGNDISRVVDKKKITANSSDITNVDEAVFELPSPRNCTYQGSNKWKAVGWTSSDVAVSPEYYAGNEITLVNDLTLYGIYNRPIVISYNGNGGTNNIPSDTVYKNLSAAGIEVNPSVIIKSNIPTRVGYVFQNMWRTTTNDKVPAVDPTKYIPGESYTFSDDTTLYAQWNISTIDKTVTVIWEDSNNDYNSRPDKIYISVYRDGAKIQSHLVSAIDNTVCYPEAGLTINVDGQEILINSDSDVFEYTFKNLQKYSPTDGHAYEYTVVQEPFESNNGDVTYSTSYSGDTWTITNTMVNSGQKKIVGTVTWKDSSNAWYLRPDTVTLTLLRTDPDTNDTVKWEKVIKVTSADSFTYEFINLDHINANGNAYIYTVVESPIQFYKINDFTGIRDDNTYFDFENTLKDLPTSMSGIAGNELIISADAFRFDGSSATGEDYFKINSTEDETVLVTLKEVKKTWSGTGVDAKEIYDINTLTGREYNVIVSPRRDTIVDYLYDGKYEVVVEDDSLYDFSKFTAGPYIENAELTVEDGRYFITYSSRYEYSAIMNLHAEIILRPWRGYTCIKETYREKDWTIIA